MVMGRDCQGQGLLAGRFQARGQAVGWISFADSGGLAVQVGEWVVVAALVVTLGGFSEFFFEDESDGWFGDGLKRLKGVAHGRC